MNNNELYIVRQLEALLSRAWVATSIFYDRMLVCKKTPEYPSLFLNYVTSIDSSDSINIEERINILCLSEKKNILPVRFTPLMSISIFKYCINNNWKELSSFLVLIASIKELKIKSYYNFSVELVEEKYYISTYLSNNLFHINFKRSLSNILSRIKGKKLPFILKKDGIIIAKIFIVNDGYFSGFLDFTFDKKFIFKNVYYYYFISSILNKLKKFFIKKIWININKNNKNMIKIFQIFGFKYSYEYSYWIKK